jgi:UDP-N-acetylglucosamine 2-epimerase (non-hydrolysing)
MKIKIMTIVGTRPEIIKLSCVISELDKHTNHILVNTQQNFDHELNNIFFEELRIRKPDYLLDVSSETLALTIGNIISKTDEVMAKENPDALLLLGDTNSCLSAIPAKRRKIPIFHMEAGNRCFDQRVPEEINRKIVDHVSDINMPYTEHARRYLIEEGIRPETIIKTGSPMKEVLEHYMLQIDGSDVLERLRLKNNGYYLVSAHREENIDTEDNLRDLVGTLNSVAKNYGVPVIVSAHPRLVKSIEKLGVSSLNSFVRLLKPLGFIDYVKLEKHAVCVISDSGTITEESSILNIPAVTIRYSHERPEGMDEGTLIMCGLKSDTVIRSIDTIKSQHIKDMRQMQLVDDYDTETVSKKVLRVIMSYTDYINRTVWFR